MSTISARNPVVRAAIGPGVWILVNRCDGYGIPTSPYQRPSRSDFFSPPDGRPMRPYEALRADLPEGGSIEEVAGRGHYPPGSFRHLLRRFRNSLLLTSSGPGRPHRVPGPNPRIPDWLASSPCAESAKPPSTRSSRSGHRKTGRPVWATSRRSSPGKASGAGRVGRPISGGRLSP